MKKIQCGSRVFFFFPWKELYFLKINSKSSGSYFLVSENEDKKRKGQIWLVDMKFSSQKYLSGLKGKFGGSFFVMFVTSSVEGSQGTTKFESQKLIAKREDERGP